MTENKKIALCGSGMEMFLVQKKKFKREGGI